MFKNDPVLMQLRAGFAAKVTTVTPPNRVRGTVSTTRHAYGFLKCEDGSSHFIPPPQMSRCLPGDLVEALVISNEKSEGKKEVVIESIVESACTTFVGVVRYKGSNPYISPEDKTFNTDFLLPKLKRDREREGDYVVARVIKHPFQDGGSHAEILEFICSARDNQAFWKVAGARHGLKQEAPTFDHDDAASRNISTEPKGPIQDLRDLCMVTIDGDQSRDIDDAIFGRMVGDQVEICVAIADPDRFLTPGGAMDSDARARGFTTYYPGLAIPMLSKVISEQGASLVEGEDRMTICCKMVIEPDGTITSSAFAQAVIRSQAKLTYDGVQSFLDGAETTYSPEVSEVIRVLDEARRRRNEWRRRNALVSKRFSDKSFVVEKFELKSVKLTTQNQAMKIVEECMIAANLCFGAFMHDNGIPCIYRRHDGFKAERLDQVVRMLGSNEITTTTEDLATPDGYAAVLRKILQRDDPALEQALVGFYEKGYHDTLYGAHYSLGLKGYATFTSPIRKYTDLINHRYLKAWLNHTMDTVEPITDELLEHLDHQAQATERASRDVQNNLLALMYSPQVKQTFQATVTSVRSNGVRAEIDETGASIFISTRSIGKKTDRFQVSPNGLSLLKGGQQVASLCDKISVKIDFVDVQAGLINGAFA